MATGRDSDAALPSKRWPVPAKAKNLGPSSSGGAGSSVAAVPPEA